MAVKKEAPKKAVQKKIASKGRAKAVPGMDADPPGRFSKVSAQRDPTGQARQADNLDRQ